MNAGPTPKYVLLLQRYAYSIVYTNERRISEAFTNVCWTDPGAIGGLSFPSWYFGSDKYVVNATQQRKSIHTTADGVNLPVGL